MKYVCIITIVFAGLDVFGQGTADLDKKNGFREYTIGSELSSFTDKIEFIKNLTADESLLYKAKERVTVDGMHGEVELAFYKNRLVEVTVFFRHQSNDSYNRLKDTFIKLYGNPVDESSSKNKPDYLNSFDRILMWKGSVIGLQYNFDVSHRVIEVIYWGINEASEKAKEEF